MMIERDRRFCRLSENASDQHEIAAMPRDRAAEHGGPAGIEVSRPFQFSFPIASPRALHRIR
jgi:hypothetical protein